VAAGGDLEMWRRVEEITGGADKKGGGGRMISGIGFSKESVEGGGEYKTVGVEKRGRPW